MDTDTDEPSQGALQAAHDLAIDFACSAFQAAGRNYLQPVLLLLHVDGDEVKVAGQMPVGQFDDPDDEYLMAIVRRALNQDDRLVPAAPSTAARVDLVVHICEGWGSVDTWRAELVKIHLHTLHGTYPVFHRMARAHDDSKMLGEAMLDGPYRLAEEVAVLMQAPVEARHRGMVH